jgi:hypothetical protein
MNLVNKTVIYKPFVGKREEGEIVLLNETYVYVEFDSEVRQFPFPAAFDGFLKLKDAKLQTEVEALIAEKKEADARKAAQDREAKLRAMEEAKKAEEERIAAQKRKANPTTYDRHADENNLAFKCNFCNGGCSKNCLGFKSVCSDEQIKYNIENKKRAWCSNNDSPCKKYLDGTITRTELDALNENGTFVCYESRMLLDWKAEAGDDLDENGVHKARRITGASKDSLAVLTTELPTMPNGKDRVIFGVFITGIVDEGDDIKAGYVKAKGDYHIELTPEEAKKMKFWHYYKNPNSPTKMQWGTGLYRYMKDTTCARILADIVDIKSYPAQKAHAQKVLEHYCALKGIDIKNIPAADGAI